MIPLSPSPLPNLLALVALLFQHMSGIIMSRAGKERGPREQIKLRSDGTEGSEQPLYVTLVMLAIISAATQASLSSSSSAPYAK